MTAAAEPPAAPAMRAASAETAPPRFDLLGCPIDLVTFDQALAWCRACAAPAADPPAGPASGEEPATPPRHARILLTVNASHLVAMQEPGVFRDSCLAADRFVADGISVVWAGRLLGQLVPERVTGCDLLTALLDGSRDAPLRVFFLGTRPQVLDALLARCAERWPQLVVAGHRDGFFTPAQRPEVIAQIRASQADMLFIGMPSPFKDTWSQQHRDEFGVHLIIGVGGSFDVLAGLVPRAPAWMQRAGMEWCWRLALEPRRLWRRVFVGGAQFGWLVLRQYLRQLRRPAGSANGLASGPAAGPTGGPAASPG